MRLRRDLALCALCFLLVFAITVLTAKAEPYEYIPMDEYLEEVQTTPPAPVCYCPSTLGTKFEHGDTVALFVRCDDPLARPHEEAL